MTYIENIGSFFFKGIAFILCVYHIYLLNTLLWKLNTDNNTNS